MERSDGWTPGQTARGGQQIPQGGTGRERDDFAAVARGRQLEGQCSHRSTITTMYGKANRDQGGREIAEIHRPNTKEPPILIESDGTVF